MKSQQVVQYLHYIRNCVSFDEFYDESVALGALDVIYLLILYPLYLLLESLELKSYQEQFIQILFFIIIYSC